MQLLCAQGFLKVHKKCAWTCRHDCIHITGAQTTFPGATTTFEATQKKSSIKIINF